MTGDSASDPTGADANGVGRTDRAPATRPGGAAAPDPADAGALRTALLTYSTRPRGGVVHTPPSPRPWPQPART